MIERRGDEEACLWGMGVVNVEQPAVLSVQREEGFLNDCDALGLLLSRQPKKRI